MSMTRVYRLPLLASPLKGLPEYNTKPAAVPVIRVAEQHRRNPAARARRNPPWESRAGSQVRGTLTKGALCQPIGTHSTQEQTHNSRTIVSIERR